MTRFFAIFFSLVLCVSTFATQASEEIGLSLPFTGRGAAYAELVKSGAKLAVDQVQGLTLNVADDRQYRTDRKNAHDMGFCPAA